MLQNQPLKKRQKDISLISKRQFYRRINKCQNVKLKLSQLLSTKSNPMEKDNSNTTIETLVSSNNNNILSTSTISLIPHPYLNFVCII